MPEPLLDGTSYETPEGDVRPLADIAEPTFERDEREPEDIFGVEQAIALAGIAKATSTAERPKPSASDEWYDRVEALMSQGLDRARAVAQVTDRWGPEPEDEPETEPATQATEANPAYAERVRILRDKARKISQDPTLSGEDKKHEINRLLAEFRVRQEQMHRFDPNYRYVVPEL